MLCPKCRYDNIAGASFCSLCQEVMNRSAAQAHINRLKLQQTVTTVPRSASHAAWIAFSKGDGRLMLGFAKGFSQHLWSRYRWILLSIVGVVITGILCSVLSSPLLHLKMTGASLVQEIPAAPHPETYLVGSKMALKPWTEHDGRLDTPMLEIKTDEAGTIWISRPDEQSALVQAKEWIRMDDVGGATTSATLPLNHPSLQSVSVKMNAAGFVEGHSMDPTLRTGSLAAFALPKFPTEKVHRGRRWQEAVVWRQMIGPWKILWHATLAWEVLDYGKEDHHVGVRLAYTVQSPTPTVEAAPAWARGVSGRVRFDGHGKGVAFYDAQDHHLTSNTLIFDGKLTIPLSDLSQIPLEERVGRVSSMRQEQGLLNLEFESKLDVRKP